MATRYSEHGGVWGEILYSLVIALAFGGLIWFMTSVVGQDDENAPVAIKWSEVETIAERKQRVDSAGSILLENFGKAQGIIASHSLRQVLQDYEAEKLSNDMGWPESFDAIDGNSGGADILDDNFREKAVLRVDEAGFLWLFIEVSDRLVANLLIQQMASEGLETDFGPVNEDGTGNWGVHARLKPVDEVLRLLILNKKNQLQEWLDKLNLEDELKELEEATRRPPVLPDYCPPAPAVAEYDPYGQDDYSPPDEYDEYAQGQDRPEGQPDEYRPDGYPPPEEYDEYAQRQYRPGERPEDRFGEYPPEGYPPPEEYDEYARGQYRPGERPEDRFGEYPPEGYPPEGYPPNGYPPNGYPPQAGRDPNYDPRQPTQDLSACRPPQQPEESDGVPEGWEWAQQELDWLTDWAEDIRRLPESRSIRDTMEQLQARLNSDSGS